VISSLSRLVSGHVAGDHRAQQVHAAVHAHQPVPARPVDLGGHPAAGRRRRDPGAEQVHNVLVALALDRVDDLERLAGLQAKHADVARLTAAHGIEDRAVEPDAFGVGG